MGATVTVFPPGSPDLSIWKWAPPKILQVLRKARNHEQCPIRPRARQCGGFYGCSLLEHPIPLLYLPLSQNVRCFHEILKQNAGKISGRNYEGDFFDPRYSELDQCFFSSSGFRFRADIVVGGVDLNPLKLLACRSFLLMFDVSKIS